MGCSTAAPMPMVPQTAAMKGLRNRLVLQTRRDSPTVSRTRMEPPKEEGLSDRDGWSDGELEGASERDGPADGWLDGATDVDGFPDGWSEGCSDTDGAPEGSSEAPDGCSEGLPEG